MIPIVAISWIQNVLQLVAVIIVFILVLVATYFTTRFVGKTSMIQNQAKNIEVKETFKVAPNKYIQIVRIGNKYYAISVSKEQINFLTELSEEQLSFQEEKRPVQTVSFKEMIDKITSKKKNKNDV